jgi:cytochrome bd-type quinol oxidase subunit 1
MDIIKSLDKEQSAELKEITLQSMYDAAKQDAISKVKHDSYRSVIVNGLIILVCIVLFITHWFWMRKVSKRSI